MNDEREIAFFVIYFMLLTYLIFNNNNKKRFKTLTLSFDIHFLYLFIYFSFEKKIRNLDDILEIT